MPPGLGGLGTVEAGDLGAEGLVSQACGHNVECNVGRILLVVTERGDGVFAGGEPMRVGCRADSRVADGGKIEADKRVFCNGHVVQRSKFHDEIVGVLAVDNWSAVGGLALLK